MKGLVDLNQPPKFDARAGKYLRGDARQCAVNRATPAGDFIRDRGGDFERLALELTAGIGLDGIRGHFTPARQPSSRSMLAREMTRRRPMRMTGTEPFFAAA